MYRTCSLLLLLTAGPVPSVYGAETATFMVIGSPAKCALYDQYEQPLSSAEKKDLPHNAPFEIISKAALMGDQITRAMHLRLLGTTYYLLLDDRGSVTGLPPSAAAERYAGATPHYDTLVVTAPSLTLKTRPSRGGERATLNKGDRVLRVFSRRGANYVRKIGSGEVYGWTGSIGGRLSPAKQRHSGKGDAASVFAPMHLRIMKQLREANTRYDSLFAYFNSRTGQRKTVPQWVSRNDGDQYRYTLEGSDEVVRVLENSTRQIVREIEQLLLGKPFQVSYRQGVITIGER